MCLPETSLNPIPHLPQAAMTSSKIDIYLQRTILYIKEKPPYIKCKEYWFHCFHSFQTIIVQ
ncbi:hypothetical protein EVA_03933 [gut metagenome]|uniref:Uncharacterized protein n=1 Tax=gut metagenome TaxID=749906 RepID=J9H2Z8_9ZZZZ